MVNGWCFGGAFIPLVACDLAVAADEATFGLSEINWGIPPGQRRQPCPRRDDRQPQRAPLHHDRADLRRPPRRRDGVGQLEHAAGALRGEVEELARELLEKNPAALHAAKVGFRNCREMGWDVAEDYLYAKLEQSQYLDREAGRAEGLKQFLDEKRIRPGLQTYVR